MAGPNPWIVLPFVVLLFTIALAPVLAAKWWSRHYPKVSFGLGATTLLYYFIFVHDKARIAQVAHDYASFIALVGSLFIVSGGVHITIKGEATPLRNVAFLLLGAILANVFGTTGAAMLLIRPWIKMNQHRITSHHIVFFIFIVGQCRGLSNAHWRSTVVLGLPARHSILVGGKKVCGLFGPPASVSYWRCSIF